MGMYYNRGRGNLPLTLSDGNAISVPGNKWVELTGADETCASVQRAVRKGQLHRKPVRAKKEPDAPAKAPKEDPKPAPKAAPKPAEKKYPAATKAVDKEQVKTPVASGDEAAASATAEPKPSTAGKSRSRSKK
jgi:hypothetical protein